MKSRSEEATDCVFSHVTSWTKSRSADYKGTWDPNRAEDCSTQWNSLQTQTANRRLQSAPKYGSHSESVTHRGELRLAANSYQSSINPTQAPSPQELVLVTFLELSLIHTLNWVTPQPGPIHLNSPHKWLMSLFGCMFQGPPQPSNPLCSLCENLLVSVLFLVSALYWNIATQSSLQHVLTWCSAHQATVSYGDRILRANSRFSWSQSMKATELLGRLTRKIRKLWWACIREVGADLL